MANWEINCDDLCVRVEEVQMHIKFHIKLWLKWSEKSSDYHCNRSVERCWSGQQSRRCQGSMNLEPWDSSTLAIFITIWLTSSINERSRESISENGPDWHVIALTEKCVAFPQKTLHSLWIYKNIHYTGFLAGYCISPEIESHWLGWNDYSSNDVME